MSKIKKFKAVVFDLNGVLILDNPDYTPSELERKVFKRMGMSLDDKSEKEKIRKELGWTEKDFWDFVNKSWGGVIPNMELAQMITKLRQQGYKTGIVSNTSGLIMTPVIKSYFGTDIKNLFDQVVISSKVGLLKPDKKIYELILRRLGVKAEESILVDDAEEYLEGAKILRITPVFFTHNKKLRKDLEKLGIDL